MHVTSGTMSARPRTVCGCPCCRNNPEDRKLDRCSRLRLWRPQAFVLAGALPVGTKYRSRVPPVRDILRARTAIWLSMILVGDGIPKVDGFGELTLHIFGND